MALSIFLSNPIEIGNQYKSRLSDSSGKTYEVISFVNDNKTIKFKGLDITCVMTWSREKVESWIKEGRLVLIGKNLMV